MLYDGVVADRPEEPPETPVRCAIYTRQSVDSQDDLFSFQVQYEACRAFVQSQAGAGWMLVGDRFDDEGYSGAMLDRPALERLLGVVRSGGADRVVVHRLDRLSRNLRHFVRLSEELRDRNVALTIVTAPMLGVAALDNMMLNVMASFAEFERDMTASRIAVARAYLKANGRRVAGAVPFGYVADPRTKQLVVIPEEGEIVLRMFQWAASKMTPSTIAAIANAQGCAPGRASLGLRAKCTTRSRTTSTRVWLWMAMGSVMDVIKGWSRGPSITLFRTFSLFAVAGRQGERHRRCPGHFSAWSPAVGAAGR